MGRQVNVFQPTGRATSIAILFLALSRPAAACEILVRLERADAPPINLESDAAPTLITLLALNTLVLTIPVTECLELAVDVTVDGVPWDNRKVQALQPMAPLVFDADLDTFSLTAAAMFRATDTTPHVIQVTFQILEERVVQASQVLSFTFRAGA